MEALVSARQAASMRVNKKLNRTAISTSRTGVRFTIFSL